MSDVTGLPGFYQGLLQAGVTHSGAIDPKVQILRREAPGRTDFLSLRNA